MLFNSFEYLFFFITVFFVFWFLLQNNLKLQNIFLLAANYFFYGWWNWKFLFLIFFISFVNYFVGIQISKKDPETEIQKRKFYLYISLAVNLGLLGVFKYFNFFSQSFSDLLNTFGLRVDALTLNIILPIGISFYTFQTLSYTLDVYRTKIKPTNDIVSFFAYASFFPLLLAGPIERANDLLTQFSKKKEFRYNEAVSAIRLIMWGLFKKVVIADRLSILVNQVYNNSNNYKGLPLILATYFFAFQIYCDFSGYTDIAIGSARLLGFKLTTNFRTPYYSKDIAEFWRRWHITLSTWLRDYIFIPLNLELRYIKNWGTEISIVITFLICGFWHGANWTFIIWGAIYGLYLVSAIKTKGIINRAYNFIGLKENSTGRKIINVFWTFHLVLFAWIFFRANSFNAAIHIIINSVQINISEFMNILSSTGAAQAYLGLTKKGIILAILSIIFMETIHFFQRKKGITHFLSTKPIVVRWTLYILFMMCIISFGEFRMQEFIYFQF